MNLYEIEYIKSQYKNDEPVGWFNPYISPELYVIPKCSKCKIDYENAKIKLKQENSNNEVTIIKLVYGLIGIILN